MNWCKPHWDRLREAIDIRGLSKFGAQSGEQAAKEIADELEGKEPAFDPLMGSWTRLNANMLSSLEKQGRASFELMMTCPMCILEFDGQPHLVDNWINGVIDDALRYAQEQRLIGNA